MLVIFAKLPSLKHGLFRPELTKSRGISRKQLCFVTKFLIFYKNNCTFPIIFSILSRNNFVETFSNRIMWEKCIPEESTILQYSIYTGPYRRIHNLQVFNDLNLATPHFYVCIVFITNYILVKITIVIVKEYIEIVFLDY